MKEQRLAATVAELLSAYGWQVDLEPADGGDLVARKGPLIYVVELKSSADARADRVIPLLSQAILQATRHASYIPGAQPFAIVGLHELRPALIERVRRFHAEYIPQQAVGLVGDDGSRWFSGKGLDGMNAEPPASARNASAARAKRQHDLFSDLNQWLLKVLLAPEVPDHLLNAPRHRYQTAAELARAAEVSAMSVSRFLRRLREEGFLDAENTSLRLVRRGELFRRWQAAAARESPELPLRFLLPGPDPLAALTRLAARRPESCIGLFAAARLLECSHVAGALPWLYVRKLTAVDAWRELIPAAPGEPPHLVLKQAGAPESLFRGAVHVAGAKVADILQVWLDVSAHPARGREQADFLAQTVLADVLEAGS